MKSMSTTEAQKNFGTLVNQACQEPVSITKRAAEIFVILPSDYYHKILKLAAMQEQTKDKAKSLRDFIGTGRQLSRFSSVRDVDAFIASNREIWKISRRLLLSKERSYFLSLSDMTIVRGY